MKFLVIYFVASSRQTELKEEKIKELKDKYETQLSGLKRELKQLEIAKRDHAVAIKKNVRVSPLCVFILYQQAYIQIIIAGLLLRLC